MRPIVALWLTAILLATTCLAVLAEGQPNLLLQAPNGELWAVADGVRHKVTPSKIDDLGLAKIPAGEPWPTGLLGAAPLTCSVILENANEDKIAVIGIIREITGMGLREANSFINSTPKTVASGLTMADAEAMAARLEEVGANTAVRC
jgi:ribosomal protein L7/L12